MSEYKPPFENENEDAKKDIFETKLGKRIIVAASTVLALVFAADVYGDYKDEATRRIPPEGSTCTIVDELDDSQREADTWFEGSEDIILGKANIELVADRSQNVSGVTEDGYTQYVDAVPDYAICDYPGESYADGGRRSVVNPDNVDPNHVTVVPESEFPESASVS